VKPKYLLEISVETLEAALAAQCGGADRVELCADLNIGGVTPSAELMSAVRSQLRIPIFVMIRPRGGDFVYAQTEYAEMKRSIGEAKRAGMNGVVLGILTKDRSVDIALTRELVVLARPLSVTFHRAFDDCGDLRRALEEIIQCGASRILTSGGAKSAPEGASMLAELVELANERIVILPGGGINASNLSEVAKHTHAREFHSGLGTRLPYGGTNYELFKTEIREMAGILDSYSRGIK
jgi:copper homeostasis protein